ncbi:MAG TPA: hypothetical protein EYH30_06140 [Anaerolineales bacterium]|nr:hypothetical protein [Anaerolineae bacterium]HIQ01693.1 hypothetical protein [Anaerolineales bacterium]
MIERREWRWAVGVALGVLAASWLPYLIAWTAAPPGTHFTGLVYNPLDGHTYIAKMRLGADGSWLFHLTYTPEPQRGAPIYLFYLLLGHLARWTNLPLLAVYHGARTVGGLALLLGLYRLTAHLTDRVDRRRLLFLLAALGAGLGWLAGPLGRETPDLWVAEAFPFVALLTNAHFPTALALMAWSAHWGLDAKGSPTSRVGLLAGTAALGAIQPFGLVPLLGGLAGAWMARGLRHRRIPWQPLGWTALAALLALPYPLYTLWATRTDPVLAAWSAQNVTPSPPPGDWLLSFGLLTPLAAVGAAVAGRRGQDADGLLLGWVLATTAGLALPLDLARRFSIGVGAAVGALAGLGWGWLGRPQRVALTTRRASVPAQRARVGASALVAFSAMTPLFLLLLSAGAALGGHPLLYLSDGEQAALTWLRDQAPHDAVVLCAPETGIFVPAWAGQRVVYGHPFETVNAEARQAQVERFWAGQRDPAWLDALGVDYLFYGPRERTLGEPPTGEPLVTFGDTAVYRR